VGQTASAAHVVWGVDDGFDAQGPPVLQVLLDAGVPLEGVDVDLGAVGDDVGLELPAGFGAAVLAALENQLDQFRAADVEVVGPRASKNARACRGASTTRVREVSTWRIDSSHQ